MAKSSFLKLLDVALKAVEIGAVELFECSDNCLHALTTIDVAIAEIGQTNLYLIAELRGFFFCFTNPSFVAVGQLFWRAGDC